MEKKRFLIPEALIVKFNDEDVIATSGEGWDFGLGEDDWEDNED